MTNNFTLIQSNSHVLEQFALGLDYLNRFGRKFPYRPFSIHFACDTHTYTPVGVGCF